MPTPRSSMTLRERQLSDELDRIRTTYSFNLGLLLTEAFVRKPWKLPLLPFSFVKLNFDFMKNRRAAKREHHEESMALDANCVLLFSTSEEGHASLERATVLAGQWMARSHGKVVVITPHQEANQFLPKGSLIYPITDPKQIEKEHRGDWNAKCEQLLSNVLETHRPANALFDGPYPYRGVLNCVQLLDQTTWRWVRPEGVGATLIAARGEDFVDIAEFGFDSTSPVQLIEPALTKTPAKVRKNVLLDARRYGQRDSSSKQDARIDAFADKGLKVLNLEQWYDVNGGLLKSDETGRLQAAILPPATEAIAVMMERSVPTLCVYNDETDQKTLKKLRDGAVRQPILFAHEDDELQLNVSIETLMLQHQTMQKTAVPVKQTDWIGQIVSSG